MNKCALFLLFTFYGSFAQELKKDYTDYHTEINKAETLFFMENKTDSALYYYDKVFKSYDFIFVNFRPLICLYCGLVAPNTDFT